MRICFASTFYPDVHKTWGGAEVACQRLRNLLVKRGHRVGVATTKPDKPPTDSLEHHAIRTWVDCLGRKGAMAMDMLIPFDPTAYGPALRLMDEMKPDVVHLHNFKELTFSFLAAAKKRDIPVVFSLYDLWAMCPQSNLAYYKGGTCSRYMGLHCVRCAVPVRKPLVLFQKPFFKHFLPKVDRFLVLSETVKRQLTEFGLPEERIRILPLPLFENFTPPPQGNLDDKTILFAGWMTRPKGLHVLIEAMPRVLERVPEASVLVVETGSKSEHKAAFVRRIAELGLEDKFRFLGKKSADEIKALLARASVVAIPEQWSMAWPIFGTEAMAFAKPVAASRIGDLPWFIRDGERGRTFDPTSHEQLADCLISFFEDPDGALAMGRRAQEFILDLCDPGKIADALVSSYEEARA